ncbi:MAG: glutathione peroxidase [Planctomycetota bacterium]|nr:glutathione peroxidase [Planctomycetota bacterium]
MVIQLRPLFLSLALIASACTSDATITPELTAKWSATGVYNLETQTLEGEAAPLSDYAGKVSLVVNVASKCGLTPQYEALQALHEQYGPSGFTVLAFPCNDFGGQEPGSPAEIRSFCTDNYEVSFPIFAKLQTKEGEGQSELYSLLGTKTGDLPGWNFGKYLIAADGTPLEFFSSTTSPNDEDLVAALQAALMD